MTDSRNTVEVAIILTPHDAQRLRKVCPDLGQWPGSWQVEPADIAFGQQVVCGRLSPSCSIYWIASKH